MSVETPADARSARERGAPRPRRVRRAVVLALLALLLLVLGFLTRYRFRRVEASDHLVGLQAGDVVAVDRRAYRTDVPQRWDVVLARAGSEEARLGRVLALPGERIRAVGTDLWIRAGESDPWRLLARPEAIRRGLFVAVFPWRDTDLDPRRAFGGDGGWTVTEEGSLRFEGGEVARTAYADPVTEQGRADLPTTVGTLVSDVRVRCDVLPRADAQLEIVWRAPAGWEVILTLSTGAEGQGDSLRTLGGGTVATHRWPAGLEVGRTTAVELEAADGQTAVRLDGVLAGRLPLAGVDPERAGEGEQRLTFGARGGVVEVRGVAIDRDAGWGEAARLAGDGLDVPPGTVLVASDGAAGAARLVGLDALGGRATHRVLPLARWRPLHSN